MKNPVEAVRDLNLAQALAVEERLQSSGIDCYVSRDQVTIPSALHSDSFQSAGSVAARCRVFVRSEMVELARDLAAAFLRGEREGAVAQEIEGGAR